MGILGRVFGTKNDRELKRLWPRVHAINALEPGLKQRSDAELAARLRTIREHVQAAFQAAERPGQPPLKREEANRLLDPHLNEVFALVREAGRRVLGMRHFDVQLLGGMVLHEGKIAEMKTGEGKTLVATLPAVLAALSGKGVHVVTVNDYLVSRDAEWMGRIYRFLGLTVGTVLPGLDEEEKKRAYAADITHGQNNEFGFDYLRDNMKYALSDYVQRDPFFAIVDEVDSILIDEARTPLIISGPTEKGTQEYEAANALVPKLRQDEHYTIDEKARVVMLTEAGVTHCEELLRLENLYDPANISLLHHTSQALRAHCLYKRDVDYIVEKGQVVIVDEHTGRLMPGRRWSDGLHQAVEAKESVAIEEENQTLATVTFQNFFRMYTKLSGMTGTADTEAEEFAKIYDLDVIVVPTNRPIARADEDDQVYKTEREKVEAVAADIKDSHAKGQPVLVGTVSVEKSEVLSSHLRRMEIPHNVLNAKHHRQEAGIIAQAGRLGAVTIATNMAGRGTDIVLGGNPEFMARMAVAEKLGGTEDTARHLGFLEEQPDFINTQRLAERDAEDSRWLHRMAHQLQETRKDVGDRRDAMNRVSTDVVSSAELTLEQVRAYTLKERKAFYDRAVQLYIEELQRCQAVCEQEKRQVIAAGGLRIIGTERHESRRIDNQLRGRSGRQGDPGSSCFYLSLQDDLMRIFGSDRMMGMMERLGMEDGVPIEHPWVSKSIAGAQKRVEGFHFDSRKQLLEYDDVMNQQRKAVYTLRRRVLGVCVSSRSPFCHPRESGDPGDQNTRGSSLSHIGAEPLSKQKEAQPPHNETIHKLIFDLVERAVVDLAQGAAPSNTPVSEWKLADLHEEVRGLFGVSVDLDTFTGSRDDLMDAVYTALERAYEQRAKQVGEEKLHELERVWYLQAIDHRWREHLQAMEHLREGIHFRGYAQKDPKQEYKREGFHLFQSMMAHIRSGVLEQAFTGEVPPDARERAQHDLAAMQRAAAEATLGARHPAASAAGAAGDTIDAQQLRALFANRSDPSSSPPPDSQQERGLNRYQRRLRKARARKEGKLVR